MKIEYLSRPSPSGDFEEVKFGVRTFAEWFLFTPEDAENFVGVFGSDCAGTAFALVSSDQSAILIATPGHVYMLDRTGRHLLSEGRESLRGGQPVPNTNRFLVFDECTISLYDHTGFVAEWGWEMFTAEDIRIDRLSERAVGGTVCLLPSRERISWRIDLIDKSGCARIESEWKQI